MKAKIKTFIAAALIILFCSVTAIKADAETRLVWISTKTGWMNLDGDTYYIHKTNGLYYKKGEPCWDEYRWHGNKLYYFQYSGQMLKHSTRNVKLNKDHSVRYIYTPGTDRRDRYNARIRRYQRKSKDGIWTEYGMQTNIPWMCDWQR